MWRVGVGVRPRWLVARVHVGGWADELCWCCAGRGEGDLLEPLVGGSRCSAVDTHASGRSGVRGPEKGAGPVGPVVVRALLVGLEAVILRMYC